MHKLAEKMADCLKVKVEGVGIDNIEGAALEELGKWVDIIKDIACYDKDMRIIKAMDEAEENEEKMKYIEEYEDYPEMEMRRGYKGQPRSQSGRFMSRGDGRRSNRGRGGRRGYEDEMYYPMTTEMYNMPIDYLRDMDREAMNRMYYSGGGFSGGSGSSGGSSGGSMGGGSMGSSGGGSRGYSDGNYGGNDGNRGGGRDSREGRSGNARRGYMETKEMGKDKQEKMKELENYMKELSSDVTEMISDASPEEKTMLKNKMQVLMTKIQ